PDVATPQSLASTTRARRPRLSGSAMPTRHGGPPAGAVPAPALAGAGAGPGLPPAHCTSPPPLTRWLADPAADKMSAARSTAQPFTYPDGSNRPHGDAVKYPPDNSRTNAHASMTSATSGAHPSTVTSPSASC